MLVVDEKSQIQALDRTQPGLPMKKGRGGTMTHDYKRNGTTTLFAALNTLTAKSSGLCEQRHRHQEWLRFLRLIDQTLAEQAGYLICDNYATHKHPHVQRWLRARTTLQGALHADQRSWLNMVERFFRDLTAEPVRRGVFQDVEELIDRYRRLHRPPQRDPKPFIWTAKASDILEKVKRAKAAIFNRYSG